MREAHSTLMRVAHTGIVAVLLLSGCSSVRQLSSYERTTTITIDGSNQEWLSVPAYAAKGKFMLSVVNDAEYVYLCISTRDEQLQTQLMGMGATVWFDPTGGSSKEFGIRYPLGFQPGGRPEMTDRREEKDQRRELRESAALELEVVGANESDRFRLPVGNSAGIQARIAKSPAGLLSYELQVPLARTQEHPYAIGASAVAHIGLGIEMGAAGRPPAENRQDIGGPPGGSDGGGRPPGNGMPGGQGGPPMGGMPPRQGGTTEAIDLWFDVTLSAHRASAQSKK